MKFNKIIPELSVSNLEKSLVFYQLAGFKIEYERPENRFVFLSLGEIQFMLQATPQILDDLDSYLPTQKDTTKIAQFFALLADQTRVRMLSALAIAPLCVTDLARVLGLNQTTVSHQLRLLRDVGVVETNRKGKIIQYKIANPKINEILLVGVEYLGY